MFLCNQCQYASVSKLGKCPDCAGFGTFVEVPGSTKKTPIVGMAREENSSHENTTSVFHTFEDTRYHRVFSGGIKQGGIYLLGGEPGIGKSTLILQILQQILPSYALYFSGEEHTSEIYRRAERVIGAMLPTVLSFHETNLENILATISAKKPTVVVIDSIQTIASIMHEGIAGSPAQVRVCADALVEYCRVHNITLLCLGHVTKGGELAGPKYLEHIVDVVLYVDGDRFGQYRTMRTTKNRFGSTDDAIVFAMTKTGLQVVGNDFRVHDDITPQSGRVLTVGLENGRPILVHVEALLTKNYNNHPQRNALGIDPKRLQLIIAILEKYCRCNLYQYDIFVNIPGEFTFYDSGVDVAIAAAIYSQYKNILPDPHAVYIGEIGLSGQIVKPKLYEKRTNIIEGSLITIETVGKRIEKVLQD